MLGSLLLFIHHSSFRIHHFLQHPRVAVVEVVWGAVGVARVPVLVAREESAVAALGGAQGLVRKLLQVALDLPDVPRREAPVVAAQLVEVGEAVAEYARRRVDVRVEVAPGELAQVSEDGLSPVEPNVARARDRAPKAAAAEDEDDVVEPVLRLEAQEQGRVAVLFEHGRREERGLKTMRLAALHDAAEAAQRRPRALAVVPKPGEVTLHLLGAAQSLHERPFPAPESLPCRRALAHADSNNKSARGRQRAEP